MNPEHQNEPPEVQETEPQQRSWVKKYLPITIIVAVILIGVGALFAMMSFSEEAEQEIDTSNWKMYEDAEFGFRLMYPESFEEVPLYFSLFPKEALNSGDRAGRLSGTKETFETGEYKFHLYDYSTPTNPAQQRTEAYVDFNQDQYLVLRNSYTEGYYYGLPDVDLQELKEILTTFSFFEDKQKLWKPYRNEEYGFQFSYPGSWEMQNPINNEIVSIREPGIPYDRLSFSVSVMKGATEDALDDLETNGCIGERDGNVVHGLPCLGSTEEYENENIRGFMVSRASAAGGEYYFVIMEHGGYVYTFPGGYDRILSTFKFIDSEEKPFSHDLSGAVAVSFDNLKGTAVIKNVEKTLYIYTVDSGNPYLYTYDAIKIIPTERAEKLGKKECYYGESGILSECNTAQEYGISFGVVGAPVEAFTSQIDENIFPSSTAEVLSKEVVSYTTGIEGYFDTTYFVPLKNNQTLLIHRKDYDPNPLDDDEFDVFPSNEEFDRVLGSLQVDL